MMKLDLKITNVLCMKKAVFIIFLQLSLTPIFSQNLFTLDKAINDYAMMSHSAIQSDMKIAVTFETNKRKLMVYFIDTMNNEIWKKNKNIYERQRMEHILNEQNLSLTGAVPEETIKRIGQLTGVDVIIYGSIEQIGDYRMTITATEVETGKILLPRSYNLKIDSRLRGLLDIPVSIGEKIGTGVTNILFGLGSYLERDIPGGITIMTGYLVAVGLFVIEAETLDWDSPAVGVPATIGVTVAGLTIVYGFARPFIHNRSPPRMATVIENTQSGIVLIPDKYTGKNHFGFNMSYTIKF